MTSADYWIDKIEEPNKVLMNTDEIQQYNDKLLAILEASVCDLTALPETFDGSALVEELVSFEGYTDDYWGTTQTTDEDYEQIRENIRNAAIQPEMSLKYGITVHYTDLKQIPTTNHSTEPEYPEWDDYMNSSLQVNEPVVIYFATQDEQFYYVRCRSYTGWAFAEDIAVCKDKEEWLEAQNMENILVVTGDRVYLENSMVEPDLSELCLHMGTTLELVDDPDYHDPAAGRIALYNYYVKMPCRDEDGSFVQKIAPIPMNRDVSEGYLELTSANLLRQSFKFLGNRYGWGGMLNAEDCSGMVCEIYHSFGFQLGRDNNNILAPQDGVIEFEDLTDIDSKTAVFDTLLPGALIGMPGHIAVYLGKEDEHYYTLSAVGSLFLDGPENELTTNTVVITELEACGWLEDINSIGSLW